MECAGTVLYVVFVAFSFVILYNKRSYTDERKDTFMIYTVTLNPSLDYIVSVDHFQPGVVNRARRESVCPGGKGINVSLVLRELGYDSAALGFQAGFTGREIAGLLEDQGIRPDFIEVGSGLSRINVKVRSREESEINGMGPEIGDADLEQLYARFGELQRGDMLVLAGSVPSGMPDTVYHTVMKRLSGKGIRIIVDATRDLLLNALPERPFLIKPNHCELGEIYGVELRTREEIVPYARGLQERGACNVLVSMAAGGAVLVTEDGTVYQSAAPEGEMRYTVGAGDSMVAGFLAGYLSSGDLEQAFYTGLCAGSASAFSDGLAKREAVRELLRQFGRDY